MLGNQIISIRISFFYSRGFIEKSISDRITPALLCSFFDFRGSHSLGILAYLSHTFSQPSKPGEL